MTTIKGNCPICGEVEFPPEVVELKINLGDQEAGSYSFLCPVCKVTQTKRADKHIAELLMSAGVRPKFVRPPNPPAEIYEPRCGPPLDIEDLRDFVRELNGLPTASVA